MGLRARRHRVVGVRGCVLGLYGLRGLRLLPLAGLTLLLGLLQFVQGGGEGSLQAHTIHGGVPQQDELLFDLEYDALRLAVAACVRHNHTRYDELLMRGVERSDARSKIRADVEDVLERWESA